MPRQQTFDLIPTTLAHTGGSRPPMTSKQAKKLYAQKNKVPKMSRAERIKLEKEELEAQRKERDKQRAAEKAKAAREKKAAKEAEERDRKRKAGLPLQDVRPSQPTISGFIRVPKRTASEMMEQDVRTIAEPATESNTTEEYLEDESPASKKIALVDTEEDDEFGGFPDMSPETTRMILSPGTCHDPVAFNQCRDKPVSHSKSRSPLTVSERPASTTKRTSIAAPMPQACLSQESEDEFGGFPDLSPDDLPTLFGEIETPTENPAALHTMESCSTVVTKGYDVSRTTLNVQDSLRVTSTVANKAKFIGNSKSSNMGPPPLPRVSNRTPLGAISTNVRSRSQSTPAKSPGRLTPSAEIKSAAISPACFLPSSTQAFLEENFDDFFPSASQQVRELMDNVGDFDIPSNTQVAREISGKPTEDPAKGSSTVLPFSTQMLGEFELSSQDLRDIETPSKPPKEPARPISTTSKTIPKRRFFEEKEEDLLYAALDESRRMAEAKERANREAGLLIKSPLAQKVTRSSSQILSSNTDSEAELDAYQKAVKRGDIDFDFMFDESYL